MHISDLIFYVSVAGLLISLVPFHLARSHLIGDPAGWLGTIRYLPPAERFDAVGRRYRRLGLCIEICAVLGLMIAPTIRLLHREQSMQGGSAGSLFVADLLYAAGMWLLVPAGGFFLFVADRYRIALFPDRSFIPPPSELRPAGHGPRRVAVNALYIGVAMIGLALALSLAF